MTSVPFHFDLGAKAPPAVELEDGDLLISGWALRFDEKSDREAERFIENPRMIEAMRRFVEGGGNVLHHHRWGEVLGRTLAMDYVPGKGIRVKAQIFNQPPQSPLRHLYDAARKGALGFFSIGGRFDRKGSDITFADVMELSICGTGMSRLTSWRTIENAARKAPEGSIVQSDGSYTTMSNDQKAFIRRAKQRRNQEIERQRLYADQASRKDSITEEIIELSAAERHELLFGSAPRTKTGAIDESALDRGFTASDFITDDPDLTIIDARERQAMFGLPAEPPPARELTVEERFAIEAKLAEKQRKRDETLNIIRDRFKRLTEKDEQ